MSEAYYGGHLDLIVGALVILFAWAVVRRRGILAAVVLAVAMPSSGLAAAQKWESLFDGKQFGRWKVVEVFDFAKHGKVEVKDGHFVLGKGRPGPFIITVKDTRLVLGQGMVHRIFVRPL